MIKTILVGAAFAAFTTGALAVVDTTRKLKAAAEAGPYNIETESR